MSAAADFSFPDVLDCTLRDGSYLIDYRFTLEDALLVAVGLQQSGVNWIEIGHGLGVGAHSLDKTKHLMSDAVYLEMLRPVIRRSRLGVFCIPGIATLKDLKAAARAGARFVRIGTDIDRVEKSEVFIKEGRARGLKVFSNFMKSYAYDADFFLRQCEKVRRWGADCAYLVDSAGGMLPEEIGRYIRSARSRCPIPLGFHGHNNLNLGVANCLAALEAGSVMLDATLQGMGRSAGNVQMESLVAVLQKKECLGHLDFFKLLDLGQNVVRPFMKNKSGVSKIGTVLGRSRFHSSFLPLVSEELAKKNCERFLPKTLIKIGQTCQTKVEKPDIHAALEAIKRENIPETSFDAGDLNLLGPALWGVFGGKKPSGWRAVETVLERMASFKHKTGKSTVLVVSGSFAGEASKTRFPFVRESGSCVIGLVEPKSAQDASRIFRASDGRTDFLMVDQDHDSSRRIKLLKLARRMRRTVVHVYRDLEAWAAGASQMAQAMAPQRAWVAGDKDLAAVLMRHLNAWKLCAGLCGPDNRVLSGDILFLCSRKSMRLLPDIRPGAMLVDTTSLSLTQAQIRAIGKFSEIRRFDGRTGLSAEVESVLAAADFYRRSARAMSFQGFKVVAGGVLGRAGDVVVDSFGPSSRILGVADGKGGFLDEKLARRHRGRLKEVLLFLTDQRLNAPSTEE